LATSIYRNNQANKDKKPFIKPGRRLFTDSHASPAKVFFWIIYKIYEKKYCLKKRIDYILVFKWIDWFKLSLLVIIFRVKW